MLDFLSNFLIYKYNDQAFSFARSLGILKKIDFFPLLDFKSDSRGIDPVFRFLFDWLAQYMNTILLNNLMAIVSLGLTFYLSYKLFELLIRNKHVALAFAFFNSTSLYFLYRVISATQNLYCVFVFPLIFILLLKKKHPLVLGIVTFLIFGFVSYYAYFISVIIGFWYLAEFLTKETKIFEFIKKELSFFLVLALSLFVFYPGLFLSNTPILNSDYADNNVQETVYRPIEDWYNFSFRPWYFVIPPQSSVFFGEFSSLIYDKITATGYYLANDYTVDEMAGTYMGWHWLIGLGVLLFLKRPLSGDQKKLLILLIGILLITLPPSFTVAGYEIYTPSYILYKVVPAFRTLVRWAGVIYLILLMLNSYLFSKFTLKKTFLLIVLNVLIFLVYVPLLKVSDLPGEVAYLKNIPNKHATVLVYPDANFYSIFWIIAHENKILNPSGIAEYREGLDYQSVTKESIFGQADYNFNYIVIYFDRITDKELKEVLPLVETYGDKVYENSYAAIYKVDP